MSSYHHGNLRATLLAAAADHVARDGADSLSMRSLAAGAGVSHGAPAHHFGDRQGVFTALAAEGFNLLASALETADFDFLEQAVAYVEFALAHPGHFAVMFRPALVDLTSLDLLAARERAAAQLSGGSAQLAVGDPVAVRTAGFSLVHGFATLYLAGALGEAAGDVNPVDLIRRMGRLLAP